MMKRGRLILLCAFPIILFAAGMFITENKTGIEPKLTGEVEEMIIFQRNLSSGVFFPSGAMEADAITTLKNALNEDMKHQLSDQKTQVTLSEKYLIYGINKDRVVFSCHILGNDYLVYDNHKFQVGNFIRTLESLRHSEKVVILSRDDPRLQISGIPKY